MNRVTRGRRMPHTGHSLLALILLLALTLGASVGSLAGSPDPGYDFMLSSAPGNLDAYPPHAAVHGLTTGPDQGAGIQVSSLECNGPPVGFDPSIPSDWTIVDNKAIGLVWVVTSDAACGLANLTGGSGPAACVNSSAPGSPPGAFDTELVSPPLDLSGLGAAAVDFLVVYDDHDPGSNDRLEVDVWNGSSWINERQWDDDHGPEVLHLNLWDYRGLPVVQFRVRTYGDGLDGYAQVDDATLGCVGEAPAVIQVEPGSLGSEQPPDVQRIKQLHILSRGGTLLNWNILEAQGDCSASSDVPWLSVSPDMGSTLPLDSATVEVTLDSTGMAPGLHTASLCVHSHFTENGLIVVPVEMSVLTSDLVVVKTANRGTAAVGDTIQYTYRVTNTGDLELSGVTAVDDALGVVPLGTNNLPPKTGTSGTLSYTVMEGDLPGPLVNTVTVTGTPPTGADVTAIAEAEVDVVEALNRVWLPLVMK